MSFVRSPDDVEVLEAHFARLGRGFARHFASRPSSMARSKSTSTGRSIRCSRRTGRRYAGTARDCRAWLVSGGHDKDGLPIGIQVVGRTFDEETVLAIAKALEQELGGIQRPPL
jgi:hypothetical protein